MQTTMLSPKQITQMHPGLTLGLLRKWLSLREENGLCRAVLKIERKLLIDQIEFNRWLEQYRGGGA